MNGKSKGQTRFYELRSKWGDGAQCVCWGLSRFGEKEDAEMRNAVMKHGLPGDGQCFCVSFTPVIPKINAAAQVRAHRIRNMKARAARFPLFVGLIEEKEMQKDYYSEARAEKDQERKKELYEEIVRMFWRKHTPEKQVVMPLANNREHSEFPQAARS